MRVYPELTVDGEFKALGDLGHTGALNDRQFSFLRSRGFTNSLTDMFGQYRSWTPTQLFTTAGSRGFFYDFSDYTTQFTDTAGTTAITGVGQSLARVNDKSGLGNHATQATAGSRPLTTTIGTGFRGVQFDGVDDFLQTAAIDFAGAESLGTELMTNGTFAVDANWDKGTGWTISGGVATKVAGTASNLGQLISPLTAGRAYRITFNVTVTAGQVSLILTGGTTNFAALNLTTSQAVSVTVPANAGNAYVVFVADAAFAGTVDNISVREVLIPADKMTVVAGVRKLSDAAAGTLVALSATPDATNGAFELRAPAAAQNYAMRVRGSLGPFSAASGAFAAPDAAVLSGLADLSGDSASIRRNGVVVATNAPDFGTGNFTNDVVYIGRQGGTSQPLNGVLTFLCVINRTLTAAELAQLEAFANGKTGAY